ncbi:TIGR02206 family membrane protein [Mycolicibacterium porcinum]|uniref:YwaF family protein n=1 Tax=Mycolicibacterium porcinum TaxID=39693 RepID=UPI001193AD91|nr:TIGR02206 family membrane protein [Mycolicibacterium porcinum]TVY03809.1 TIGR02206 family membrane protein [Mycolicibacterium porcinum]
MLLSQRQFTVYGPSHWATIAVFVVGAVVLVWFGRRQTQPQSRLLGRVLGAVTAAIYVAMFAYTLVPPSIERSVPLRLTDLATVVGAYALWSQRHWAYVLTYYWGLVLSTQALISPVLKSPDFPHYEFLAFWSIHLLVVWAAIDLTWGRGMRPHWRDYRLVVMVTAVWAGVTMAFNGIAGTNYGFLNAKPATASLLDLMGPWPVYVVVASALVAGVWALMTWPWERRSG